MIRTTSLLLVAVAIGALQPVVTASPADAADRLTASEIRGFLYGGRMSGVLLDTGERWYECIAPSGDTVYNIEGQVSTGYVEVDEGGRTCFTYPRLNDTSRSCFFVVEEAGKRVFVEEDSGIRFRVDRVDGSFDGCEISAPVS